MPDVKLSHDNYNRILEILGREREQAHSISDIISVNELTELIHDFQKALRPETKKTRLIEGG